MMSIVDLIAIDMETLMIHGGCYLEKKFTKLFPMNLFLVLRYISLQNF